MVRAISATLRNAALSFSSFTSPPLQLRALQPCRTFYAFHAWRPTTNLRSEATCPPYPYGARQTYKEADTGLYGGTRPQSGNKVSKGKNKGKTLRRWYPNVRLETIRSEALGKTMTIRITAACMRTIRKCGGLDQYLLGDKPARIKELGLFGWQLRWRVLRSSKMQHQLQKERESLGLPPAKPYFKSFEEAWKKDEELREEVREEQMKQWQELKEKDARFLSHMAKLGRPTKAKRRRKAGGSVVPPFDIEAFNSLIPAEAEQQTAIES
jgi:large subunit ribosomal protein L28